MTAAERRAAIVEAAIERFAMHGFRGTTTRELAAAAGVSEPVLYQHFATKRDLYTAIVDHLIAQTHARFDERARSLAPGCTDREFFQWLGEAIISYYPDTPDQIRLLLFSALEGHELAELWYQKATVEFIRWVEQYVEKRVAEGAFSDAGAGGGGAGVHFHGCALRLFGDAVSRAPAAAGQLQRRGEIRGHISERNSGEKLEEAGRFMRTNSAFFFLISHGASVCAGGMRGQAGGHRRRRLPGRRRRWRCARPWPNSARWSGPSCSTGSLAADDTTTVSSEVAGRVAKLHFDFGDTVKKGQVMAELDRQELELQLQRARASLEQAMARVGMDRETMREPETTPLIRQAKAQMEDALSRYENAKKLVRTGDIAQERFTEIEKMYLARKAAYDAALDDLRTQLALIRALRAEVALAEKRLRDATVVAPMDGIVQARHAAVGQYLRENTPIYTLVKAWPLRLRVEIPESAVLHARARVRRWSSRPVRRRAPSSARRLPRWTRHWTPDRAR